MKVFLIKKMHPRAKHSYRSPDKSDQSMKVNFHWLCVGSGVGSVDENIQSSDKNYLYGNY